MDLMIFLKRAVIFTALFFSMGAFANKAVRKTPIRTETYSDIIEKAHNLCLQKERNQAVLVLVNAIKKESKKSAKASKELEGALAQVSSTFYSDKAQQLYELGISLRTSDPGLATQKITEALKIEPDNILVQAAQLRLQIMLGDCSQALNSAKKMKEQNPYSEEIDLLISQSAVCAGQFEAYLQFRPSQDDRRNQLWRQWKTVEVEYLFKKGLFPKGIEACQQVERADSKFPEAFFWEWKIQVEINAPAEMAGGKYLNLCKAMSARAQREYLAEPFLCRRMTEVETFLKKNNNSSL